MTREEFIKRYAKASGLVATEDGVLVGPRKRVALPCDCGDERCQGWAMVNDDSEAIADHMALYGPMEEAP